MKKLIFFFVYLVSLHSWGQKKVVIAEARIPEGYYTGNGFLMAVYVKVGDEKINADFVCIEKYPRSLFSETLRPDQSDSSYVGNYSRIYSENGKYYVTIERKGTVFWAFCFHGHRYIL